MPKARPLSKNEITAAMNKTKSVRAASRYLNCSYQHLKKWMLFYDGEGGGTLFDQHKNQSGKGIPKFLSHTPFGRKEPAILDIIEGRADPSNFNPQKIKYRLIEGGYLKEECYKCGFHERRLLDYKMPFLTYATWVVRPMFSECTEPLSSWIVKCPSSHMQSVWLDSSLLKTQNP